MERKTLLISAALFMPMMMTNSYIASESIPCIERTDGNGNKTYFKSASVSHGAEGMTSNTIPTPKRFFTIDLPGGKNYYKNRYGGMSFFSGECSY